MVAKNRNKNILENKKHNNNKENNFLINNKQKQKTPKQYIPSVTRPS